MLDVKWQELPRDLLKYIAEYDQRFIIKGNQIMFARKINIPRSIKILIKYNLGLPFRKYYHYGHNYGYLYPLYKDEELLPLPKYLEIQHLYDTAYHHRLKHGYPALCNPFSKCGVCLQCK